jgi:hypothetical protein
MSFLSSIERILHNPSYVIHCQFQLTKIWKIIWTLNYLPPFLITIAFQLTETAMWRMWRIVWKPNYLIPFQYPPTWILKNKINMCFFMSIIFNYWKPCGNIRGKKRVLIVNGIAQSPSLIFSIFEIVEIHGSPRYQNQFFDFGEPQLWTPINHPMTGRGLVQFLKPTPHWFQPRLSWWNGVWILNIFQL